MMLTQKEVEKVNLNIENVILVQTVEKTEDLFLYDLNCHEFRNAKSQL